MIKIISRRRLPVGMLVLIGLSVLISCGGGNPADLKGTDEMVITAIIGADNVGATLRLEGLFFGIGGTIITWDDFEGYNDGDPIDRKIPPIGPAWESNEGTAINDVHDVHISSFRSVSGQNSAISCWNDGQGSSNWASRFGWQDQGPFTSIYVSFHRYLAGSGPRWDSGSGNHKAMYIFGGLADRPQIVIGATINGNTWLIGTNGNLSAGGASGWFMPKWAGDDYLNNYGKTFKWDQTKGVWQRWEIYSELNKPYTKANDKIQFFHDMRLMFESDTKQLTDGGFYEDIRFGHMDNTHAEYDSLCGYMDDIYIATSRARVEVGDDPDFYQCTKRDIQIFSSWTDTAIEFVLRTPSFTVGENRYVFVVDHDGQWTSKRFGTQGDGE